MDITKRTFLLVFILLNLGLQAQSLEVEVSRDSILLGNNVKLYYELKNLEADIPDPVIDNCQILGPSISSQYQNINGEESQKKTYSYTLIPTKEGNLVIKSITVESHGAILSSDPLTISVLPNPDGIIEEETTSPDPFQNFYLGSPFELPQKEEILKQPNPNKSKRKRRKI